MAPARLPRPTMGRDMRSYEARAGDGGEIIAEGFAAVGGEIIAEGFAAVGGASNCALVLAGGRKIAVALATRGPRHGG
jgi:hypothetical protein